MHCCSSIGLVRQKTRTIRRRGAASVELAVLAPFLGLFLIGMFEIGRATMVTEALENAARKGCNTGSRPGMYYTDVTSDVNNILSDNNIPSNYATISVGVAQCTNSSSNPPTWGSYTAATSNGTFNPGTLSLIAVQVSIPASRVLWFNAFFLNNLNITSSRIVMVRAG